MNSEHRWMPTRARAEGSRFFGRQTDTPCFNCPSFKEGDWPAGVADKSLSRGESGGLFINHVTV